MDAQVAKLRGFDIHTEDIEKLKKQLHQAKVKMARGRAESSSKGKKEDSQDVGSKRNRQQAKRAKASRLGPSPPSPPEEIQDASDR